MKFWQIKASLVFLVLISLTTSALAEERVVLKLLDVRGKRSADLVVNPLPASDVSQRFANVKIILQGKVYRLLQSDAEGIGQFICHKLSTYRSAFWTKDNLNWFEEAVSMDKNNIVKPVEPAVSKKGAAVVSDFYCAKSSV